MSLMEGRKGKHKCAQCPPPASWAHLPGARPDGSLSIHEPLRAGTAYSSFPNGLRLPGLEPFLPPWAHFHSESRRLPASCRCRVCLALWTILLAVPPSHGIQSTTECRPGCGSPSGLLPLPGLCPGKPWSYPPPHLLPKSWQMKVGQRD